MSEIQQLIDLVKSLSVRLSRLEAQEYVSPSVSPTTHTHTGYVSDGDTLSTGLTFPVAGLHILDTNASHDLIVSPGSDLTADRTLTITTGDADRTLTLTGAASIEGTNTGDQTNITGNAATVTVADAAADTTTWPLLGTAQTGNLAPATDDTLTYNANTGALSATTFVGALTGTASGNLVSGGALGTPSSGTLTNATGLPISTGVSGLGANVATFLATPSSANLAAAVTGETGTGALVFGTSPAFTTGLSTPAITTASGALTVTPAAGSGVSFALSTTGDFAVNTNDLCVDTSTSYVGIGTTAPGAKLDVDGLMINGSTNSSISDGGTLRKKLEWLGATNSWGVYNSNDSGSNWQPNLVIEAGGNVGIGTTSASAKLHVDQSSTTGAVPVLLLDQADTSEEFIEFTGTVGTGNSIEAVGAKSLTTTHFLRINITGVGYRYIPVGTIA